MSDEAHAGLVVAQQSPLTQANRILDILRRRTSPELKPSTTAGSRCVQVSLVHFVTNESGSSSPAHIDQKIIPEKLMGDALDAELGTIAEELAMEAIHHASCSKSTQMYAIVFYGKSDVVLQQHRFTAGPNTRDMLDGETEPANIAGITTHLMRHSEISMRVNQESWRITMDLLAGENQRLRDSEERLRARCDEYETKRMALMDLMEGLKDGKARRDQEAAESAAMAARGEKILTIVTDKILPELVAKYSPSAPAKSVLGTLKAHQVIDISAILTDEQKKAFWELLPEETQAEILAAAAAGTNGTNGAAS